MCGRDHFHVQKSKQALASLRANAAQSPGVTNATVFMNVSAICQRMQGGTGCAAQNTASMVKPAAQGCACPCTGSGPSKMEATPTTRRRNTTQVQSTQIAPERMFQAQLVRRSTSRCAIITKQNHFHQTVSADHTDQRPTHAQPLVGRHGVDKSVIDSKRLLETDLRIKVFRGLRYTDRRLTNTK